MHGLCWVANSEQSAIDDPEARAMAVWDWAPGEARTMPGLRVPGADFCAAGTLALTAGKDGGTEMRLSCAHVEAR